MKAMILSKPGSQLEFVQLPTPVPAAGQLLVEVAACAVCRTDLHVVDGELPEPKYPLIPGHEIVGRVVACGPGIDRNRIGERVGIPWLGHTCRTCRFCRSGRENLCEFAKFTGYQLDGGYATHVVADSSYSFALPPAYDDVHAAPLLCAGLIGYRALKAAGDAERIGIYGFGAAAHIIAQVAVQEGRKLYAFTRPGDSQAQRLAAELGCVWSGASDVAPPERLDAAIIFAPVGSLVPLALKSIEKGGTLVLGGIHMSPIPQMSYELLWGERVVRSIANLTRQDALEFLDLAGRLPIKCRVKTFPLVAANDALAQLRVGNISGAAVLVPECSG